MVRRPAASQSDTISMAVIKHKAQRVGIFIDTQNLYHSAKNLYKAKVNFGQVVKEALAGRTLIRAVFAGGAKKADWDLGTVVDLVAMAQKLDTIILATGDGDFVPVVEYLKYAHGCQVEVIAFGKSASGQLREAADDFIDMCEDPRNYLIGYRGGGKWIPGFGAASNGKKDGEAAHPEDYSDGEDPAIKMSGEE